MKNFSLSYFAPRMVLFGLAVILMVGCANIPSAGGDDPSSVETGNVETITISENIEAAGNIEAAQEATLSWKTSGIVDQVLVSPGDRVEAGQIVATLQESSVPPSILAAHVDLITAQQALDDLTPTALAIAQAAQQVIFAQDDVDTKQERVDYLGEPAGEGDIEQARATATLAKIALDKAWENYEPYQNKPEDNVIRANFYNKWAQAKQSYDSAVRRLNNLTGVSVNPLDFQLAEADLMLAQEKLADARQRLDDLKAGADPQDVAAAEARLMVAQMTLESLHVAAPFSGEVLVVDAQSGDLVTAAQPVMTIANRDQLFVNALIDETEIAGVQVGTPAVVTLDAFPGVELQGEVTFINPIGQTVQGNIKYEVEIALEKPENPVLLGTSANVELITGDPREVLMVPVRAIQTDEQGEYVNVLAQDGTFNRVNITTGRLQGDQVVVFGELTPGDQVLLPEAVNEMFDRMNSFGQ